MGMTRIKICGLSREADIEAVNLAKPDYCGFIIDFPRSHRNVSPKRVEELVKLLDEQISTVGVVVNQPLEKVAALLRDGVVDIVQLHGDEDEEYITALRQLVKDSAKTEIWKAFKVRDREDVLRAFSCCADKIVLDNGYGTGQMFDWTLLQDMAHDDKPWFLAGGLDAGNISAAITGLKPWGVDVSSGVETDKIKDREKILQVVELARR